MSALSVCHRSLPADLTQVLRVILQVLRVCLGWVQVAVLDTGVDHNHPAFDGVTFACKDFTVPGYPEVMQKLFVGHRTACSYT